MYSYGSTPHGPYVWGAYAIALMAIIYLVWSPLARRKQFFRDMHSAAQRQQLADEPRETGEGISR
mgnify:CR=1 FL=1